MVRKAAKTVQKEIRHKKKAFPFMGHVLKKTVGTFDMKAYFSLALNFILAAVLTRAVVFKGYAPFGLAFAASAGGMAVPFAASGAFLGYLLKNGETDGLKYAAAVILTSVSGLVFSKSKLSSSKVFMPACAAVSMAICGFAFVAIRDFEFSTTAFYAVEVLIVFCASYFYRAANDSGKRLEDMPDERLAGRVVLLCSVLIAFISVELFGISPARAIAAYIVMHAAFSGGVGFGAATGVAAGAVVDIALGTPFYSAVYGFSGLLAGAFRARGRFAFAVSFVMANASASVWGAGGMSFGLYEVFIASVIFMITPDTLQRKIAAYFSGSPAATSAGYTDRVKDYAQKRIADISGALHELYVLMSPAARVSGRDGADLTAVFERAADRVCAKCEIKNACWERDYITTKNALNDAYEAIIKRGYAGTEDFPEYFISRCIKNTQFVGAVNDGLSAVMLRKRYKNKLCEEQELVGRQYKGISGILSRIAADVSTLPEAMSEESRSITRLLCRYQVKARAVAYRGEGGRMWVEIDGDNLMPILDEREEFTGELLSVTGNSFCPPERIQTQRGMRLRFAQAENFGVEIAAATIKKEKEGFSGDSGTYFKTDSGIAHIILSDGMGTGREAALLSASAVKLTERFLRSGVSPPDAIGAILPSLILKSDGTNFATMDIASIDLFTGNCEMLKCGAPPTYIKDKNGIRRIIGNSVPAGICADKKGDALSDRFTVRLSEEDIVIMASDGVAEYMSDEWLLKLAQNAEGKMAKDIAAEILKSARKSGGSDDMTVIVIKIKPNADKIQAQRPGA